jgi:hypothetical protein
MATMILIILVLKSQGCGRCYPPRGSGQEGVLRIFFYDISTILSVRYRGKNVNPFVLDITNRELDMSVLSCFKGHLIMIHM